MTSRLATIECNVTAEQLLCNCCGEGVEEMVGITRGLGYGGAITHTELAEGSRAIHGIENDSHSHSQHDGTNMVISSLSHKVNYVRRYLPHYSLTDNENDSHSHLQIVTPPLKSHAPPSDKYIYPQTPPQRKTNDRYHPTKKNPR